MLRDFGLLCAGVGLWCGLVGLPAGVEAREITVAIDGSGDHDRIQQAIDAATPGDEVVVLPGEYVESLSIGVDDLRVRGRDGAAATTVRAASPSLPVVRVSAQHVSVEGLEIRGGQAGLRATDSATVTVRGCRVADSSGRGIDLVQALDVAIHDTTIEGHGADGVGGLFSQVEATLLVAGCTVQDNGGDGIAASGSWQESDGSWPDVGTLRVTIRECTVRRSGDDGVHVHDAARLEILHCAIERNATDGVRASMRDVEGELVASGCLVQANGGCGIATPLTLGRLDVNVVRPSVSIETCRVRRNGGGGVWLDSAQGEVAWCSLEENAGSGIHMSPFMDVAAPDPMWPWPGPPWLDQLLVSDSVIARNVGPGVSMAVDVARCRIECNADGVVRWPPPSVPEFEPGMWSHSISDTQVIGNECADWLLLTESFSVPEMEGIFVERCLFLGNRSRENQGVIGLGRSMWFCGVECHFGGHGSLENVTVADNLSSGFAYSGGYGALPIARNIVWGNSGRAFSISVASPVFPWDEVREGVSVHDNCGEDGLLPEWPDNVEADPRFVRRGVFDFTRYRSISIAGSSHLVPDFIVDRGDYRVEPDSPAVGMGTEGVRGDLPPEGRPGRVVACRFPLSPVVDGALDDEVWETARWHGPTLRLEQPAEPGDADFELATAADALWLYVAVRVTDDVLVRGESEPPALWSDDSVEVFLDPDHAGAGTYGADDVQVTLATASIGRSVLDPLLSGVGDGAGTGTRAAVVRSPGGWVAEIAIPLRVPGRWDIAPRHGDRVGFDLHLNDDDDRGTRDTKLIWSRWDFDRAWEDPGVFGALEFVRSDGEPPAGPEVEVLPSPVDFGEVEIGREARREVTVRNVGSAMLDLASPRLADGSSEALSLAAPQPPRWLAPEEEARVEIVFLPTDAGAAAGSLVLETDDPDEPVVVVTILGEGRSPYRFVRGDTTGDGSVDITDAIRALVHLFRGGVEVASPDAADVNDDGILDLGDPVHALGFLFRGTAPPLPPFPGCGVDTTEDDLPEAPSPACGP